MKKSTAYSKYADSRAKKSTLIPDCIRAFFVGGIICSIGQGFTEIYSLIGISEEATKILVPITIIFITALLTGFGIFDNIAKFGGAGTLVPISGFANAMVSPAIDSKNEGFVLGVGANMFKIAGPVILYGTAASVIYGVVYWLIGL